MKRTPNINLPVYETSDKFYITDMNETNEKIDKAIKDAVEVINSASLPDTAVAREIVNLKEKNISVESSLAQKANQSEVRLKSVKNELEDMSPTVLAAIQGGEGTTFNLLSIPQENSVTPSKTTFINMGENLLNPSDVAIGVYVSHTNGSLVVSASRNVSGFIAIKPSTAYTIKELGRTYAFYDNNKSFISGADTADRKFNHTITTPANASYLRFSYYPSYIPTNQQMIVEGTAIPNMYVPYKYTQPYLEVTEQNLSSSLKQNNKVNKDEYIAFTNYWSDITFVENQLWAFYPSDTTDGGGIGYIYIFNENYELIKTLNHNFGHVNTIEYCNATDSLIFGNGSGSYGTDGAIHIIQGVKHWIELADNSSLDINGSITGSVITTIPVGRLFGDKVNVCWGEDNNQKFNICYVISNDNKNVRRVILGSGANNLESGTLISNRTTTQFNGTYRVIDTWSTTLNFSVNQGSCYYNGYLWFGAGHDGLRLIRYKLEYGGAISYTSKAENIYDDLGVKIASASEGVTVKDGMIYHGTKGNTISAIYKYRPF